ncbi:hypothetical protein LELG_04782 [Lodderomyces elongisporus NRRL YB-4239]|uniref:Small ribosomal subunit protein uS11m n=1 Tax=Lodderomyces elongisporus (strain ATCC 11503 / CBS 2605 / JCM 1781 / NBRC 1676 / NRRL YB-4239) TaxID=379508 RepID=A5E593_LODEL|nr:hypothetical protein LELG_04782 [Lodderomyces elongisporus NRRL YB-4239]
MSLLKRSLNLLSKSTSSLLSVPSISKTIIHPIAFKHFSTSTPFFSQQININNQQSTEESSPFAHKQNQQQPVDDAKTAEAAQAALDDALLDKIDQQKQQKIKKEIVVDEKVVSWKLYGRFNRHNTRCTLVAVVEDLNFMKNNEHLSYNDKVIYYMQLPHKVKYDVTAGMLGFRKTQRQEYEAGFQVAAKMFKTIQERNYIGPNDKVELVFTNFGKGRQAFEAALLGKEGSFLRNNIVRIVENTTLKFGGHRSKKVRRL